MALPLLILFTLKGGATPFAIFTVVLSFVGLLEFYRLALPDRRALGVLFAAVGSLPVYLFHRGTADLYLATLTLLVLAMFLHFLFHVGDMAKAAAAASFAVAGLLYVPLLMGHLVLLRDAPHGIEWIFLLLLLVMSGDTGAYYTGRAIGRHKLYPAVSPNKTIEGSTGGLAGSFAGAFIARATFFPELTLLDCVATAAIVAPMGQLGDLFESLLKRSFGVKDSGSIFPGHGGMLDRLDSVLFGAPVLYYYCRYLF